MPETQPASTNSTCANAPGRGGPGLTSPALGTRDGRRAHGGWPPSQHVLRAPWNLAWVASALGLAEHGVVAGGRGDRRGGASACAPLGATFAGARNVTGRHGAAQDVTGRHRTSQGGRGGRGGSGRHGAAHERLRLWPLRRHFPCHARGARRPLGASESPGPGDAGAPGACQDVRAENKGLTAEGSRRHGRRTPPRARARCTASFSTLGRTRRGPQGLAARTLRAACARLPHTLQSTTHRHRVSDRRENRRDFASP